MATLGGMSSADQRALQDLADGYSPTRRRTIDTALRLFAEHGVGGTSLQMIADDLGVTKAAIYHQFPTKDEIVLAVVEVQLAPLERAIGEAEAAVPEPGPARRTAILGALVDAVVSNRHTLSILQGDPVIFRTLGDHPPSRRLWDGLFRELLSADAGAASRVRASVVSAILGTVAFPLVQDVDDDTLRAELTAIATAVLDR